MVGRDEIDAYLDVQTRSEADRVCRPEFLRALLLGKIEGAVVPETGLKTSGLVFETRLALEYADRDGGPLPPIWLREALFKAGAGFGDAQFSRLDLAGSQSDGVVNLDRARILANVWFDRLTVRGGLSLMGAEIGGQLALEGVSLKGAVDDQGRVTGNALSADGAVIKGDVFCRPIGGQRFEAEGEVRLLGAKIGGQLNLRGASLKGAVDDRGRVTGDALSIDRAVIEGGVFCNPFDGQRFEAEGEVRLLGAKIGGQLNLRGAKLKGAVDDRDRVTGDALNAERAKVADATFLDADLVAEGPVILSGAKLADLTLQGQFTSAGPAHMALDLSDTTLRRLLLRPKNDGPAPGITGLGKVGLEGATADTFDGFFPDRWGAVPTSDSGLELDLDGFTYRRAEFEPTSPHARHRKWARFWPWDRHPISENVLNLLDREFRTDQPGRVHYLPQPFEAAARALREAGYDREANAVAVAKREFKRRCKADGHLASFISGMSCLFFRHGYGPIRATLWMILLVALGAGAVSLAQAHELLVAVPGATAPCTEYPIAYALDAFLPLVDLGVDKACEVKTTVTWGWEAEAFRVAYAILGWLFVPMVALTYAGVLRKD